MMKYKDKKNTVKYKSKIFALQIIKLYKYLYSEKREFVLSKQVLRSGTSIGANIKEGSRGQTTPDFFAKMNVALKEASETEYWLELLYESDYITIDYFNRLYANCQEIMRMLTAICKTSFQQLKSTKK